MKVEWAKAHVSNGLEIEIFDIVATFAPYQYI